MIGDGRSDPTPLKVPAGIYAHPRVSPDGRLLAVSRSDAGSPDIWTYELSGGAEMQRLTFGGRSRFPIWSADSRRVTYQSIQDRGIWWEAVDGGTPERLTTPLENEEHAPESWSPDGSRLLFAVRKGSVNSLWVLTMPDRKTMPVGQIQSAESLSATFSPDGRWIAYASSERSGGVLSPNRGVFVEPFPPTGAKRQAPKRLLDYHPRWAPDGKRYLVRSRRGTTARPGSDQASAIDRLRHARRDDSRPASRDCSRLMCADTMCCRTDGSSVCHRTRGSGRVPARVPCGAQLVRGAETPGACKVKESGIGNQEIRAL